jgi:hypothetical protein
MSAWSIYEVSALVNDLRQIACILRPACCSLTRQLASLSDPETQSSTDKTRKLGLVVVRGTQVSLVAPQDGAEEIANPFIAADDDE